MAIGLPESFSDSYNFSFDPHPSPFLQSPPPFLEICARFKTSIRFIVGTRKVIHINKETKDLKKIKNSFEIELDTRECFLAFLTSNLYQLRATVNPYQNEIEDQIQKITSVKLVISLLNTGIASIAKCALSKEIY